MLPNAGTEEEIQRQILLTPLLRISRTLFPRGVGATFVRFNGRDLLAGSRNDLLKNDYDFFRRSMVTLFTEGPGSRRKEI